MTLRLLKSWQKQIPLMSCESGCRECCEGYAPSMTLGEWREIRHPGKIVKELRVLQTCPFLGEFGCEIYARRPLICRIFGTVSRAEIEAEGLSVTLPVCCPRGCEPSMPLPLRAALSIQVQYHSRLNGELLAVTKDFRKWERNLSPPQARRLGQWTPGPRNVLHTKPGKFEWLYYVLCTRDGQNNLRQLYGQGHAALAPEELGRLAAMIGG